MKTKRNIQEYLLLKGLYSRKTRTAIFNKNQKALNQIIQDMDLEDQSIYDIHSQYDLDYLKDQLQKEEKEFQQTIASGKHVFGC